MKHVLHNILAMTAAAALAAGCATPSPDAGKSGNSSTQVFPINPGDKLRF